MPNGMIASYELAHQARKKEGLGKGTATMTIEPAPLPHNEILDLPDKTGRTTQGGIDKIPSTPPGKGKLTPLPVHPGEYSRSAKYSPITKI